MAVCASGALSSNEMFAGVPTSRAKLLAASSLIHLRKDDAKRLNTRRSPACISKCRTARAGWTSLASECIASGDVAIEPPGVVRTRCELHSEDRSPGAVGGALQNMCLWI